MGYTKTIQSGRTIEFYEFERELPSHRFQKRRKPVGLYDFKALRRRGDNIQKQKKNFVRLVRANLTREELPIFLTLTMREITTLEFAQNRFNLFIKQARQGMGKSFRYISVPEFQKRGAVHFHVIVFGWPDKIIKDERRTRYIAKLWGQGFVDLLITDGSPALAGYMGKYLSKALSDYRLGGKRGYNASHNVRRPAVFRGDSIRGFSQEIWGIELSTAEPLHQRTYRTQWLGECNYKVYELDLENNVN